MLFVDPPISPVIIQVVEQPTRETTVGDVLMGTVGLIGVLIIGAVLLGLLMGGVLVAARMRRARQGLHREFSRTRLGLGPQSLTLESSDSTSPAGYPPG